MKPLRDWEELRRWSQRRPSEEEELREEDQEDVTTVMRKDIWLEIVLIRGGHGALTAEPMGMLVKTSKN
jgi:hypothetical protein